MRLPPQYWISSYKRIHLSKNSNYCDKKSAFCQFIQWCITFHGTLNKTANTLFMIMHFMSAKQTCQQANLITRNHNKSLKSREEMPTKSVTWFQKSSARKQWLCNIEPSGSKWPQTNWFKKTFLIETLTPLGSHAHYNNHECWLSLLTILNWVVFCTSNRYLDLYSR